MAENPLAEIREAVQQRLADECPTLSWVDIYDGEDSDSKDFEDIRRRVRNEGTGAYVRLLGTDAVDTDHPGYITDTQRVYVQVLIGAALQGSRRRCAEEAEHAGWMAYQAVRRQRTPAWIGHP